MDPALLAMCRLSKAGFGTMKEIGEMPVTYVLAALNFNSFIGDYENAHWELNKPQT
jgi:hypothetical protein